MCLGKTHQFFSGLYTVDFLDKEYLLNVDPVPLTCSLFVKAVAKLFLPLPVMWQPNPRMFFSPYLIWHLCCSWGNWLPFFWIPHRPGLLPGESPPRCEQSEILAVGPRAENFSVSECLFRCLWFFSNTMCLKQNSPIPVFPSPHNSLANLIFLLCFTYFLFFIFYKCTQWNIIIATPASPSSSPHVAPKVPPSQHF